MDSTGGLSRHVAENFFGPAGKATHAYDPAGQPWMSDALCQFVDPELFFPKKTNTGREAKRICGVCPVLEECREWAIETPKLQGIWGGLNEKDRMKVRMGRMMGRER